MNVKELDEISNEWVEDEIYQALGKAFGIDCCELDMPLTKREKEFIEKFWH